MNIQFKSLLNDTKLNNGGVKTTIDQSAVTAGENTNVDLNLNSENGTDSDNQSQKKKKEKADFKEEKKTQEKDPIKSEDEIKALNLKLLNLL